MMEAPVRQSTIEQYIQRAMQRMQNRVQKDVEKTPPLETAAAPIPQSQDDYVHLTNSLINSFSIENGDTKEVPVEEYSTVHNEREKSNEVVQSLYSTSRPMRDTCNDLSLIKSVSQLKPTTIRALANVEKPSQCLINIMISYIALLQVVEPKEWKDDFAKIQDLPKTYANCVKLLKQPELILRLTFELASNISEAPLEYTSKILKIKEKYLLGADMKPSSISDKYQSAKTILNFMLDLLRFIERKCGKNSDKKVQSNYKKPLAESPVRKLINRKTPLTLQLSKGRNSQGKRAATPIIPRAVSEERTASVSQRGPRKSNNDLIQSLLKSLKAGHSKSMLYGK